MSPCHHHPIAPYRWLCRAKLGCGDAGGGAASLWQGGGHCLPFPRGLQVAPFLRGVAAVPCRRQPALLCADLWGELSEALGKNPPLRGVLDALCLCMGVGCLDPCGPGCSRWSREDGGSRAPRQDGSASALGSRGVGERCLQHLGGSPSAANSQDFCLDDGGGFRRQQMGCGKPSSAAGRIPRSALLRAGVSSPHPDAAIAFPGLRGMGDPSPC